MSLSRGTRLGPYEILAPIGAGGMGEVYRARDTRLARDVALKTLPESFADDLDRLRRFEHEALAASALAHPNIVAVYDVGTHEGTPYLVSELVEGDTLRAQLGSPLPLRRAAEYGVQIARGLAAAHEKGIVHRDLKPENILVTRDGHVKILDFGLAKLTAAGRERDTKPNDATVSVSTEPGTVLGTVGYMSPEQVRGLPTDHRSDIFSFGAVLYEMLAGSRAFRSASEVETMHAILHADPPELPEERGRGPFSLLVRRCLEKDPASRFQSSRDLSFALEASALVTTAVTKPPAGLDTDVRGRPRRLGLAAALALAGVASAAAVFLWLRGARPAPVIRFAVAPPLAPAFAYWERATSLALSPDGGRLAFTARDENNGALLFVRSLDEVTARQVAGSEGATAPFWSPDGASIAFFAKAKLKRVGADGSGVQVVCDTYGLSNGTWGADGVIVFEDNHKLARVSVTVGTPNPLDPKIPGAGFFWPRFLPDGRRFLCLVESESASKSDVTQEVWAVSLDGAPAVRVMPGHGSRVAFAPPSSLLFVRDATLLFQRLDLRSLRLLGAPETIARGIRYGYPTGSGDFDVAAGTLAYQTARPVRSDVRWYSRSGEPLEVVAKDRDFGRVRLSPDGSRIAIERMDEELGSKDIWIYDTKRGAPLRFTPSPLQDAAPVWSPDGERIVFLGGVPPHLLQKSLTDAGPGEELLAMPGRQLPVDWSSDGKVLLFQTNGAKGRDDLYLLPMTGPDRKPIPLLTTPYTERDGALSPDARWIAYSSDESGAPEVYIRPISGPGAPQRVSTKSGAQPRWQRDGSALFYQTDEGIFVSAIRAGAHGLEAGDPVVLFRTPRQVWGFDVSPDGQRFIIVTEPVKQPDSITVVAGWRPPA